MNQHLADMVATIERGKAAVMELRREQLTKIGTFLLSKEGLNVAFTRMEYADGRIAVVKRKENSFSVQQWLSSAEESAYRQAHQLPQLEIKP